MNRLFPDGTAFGLMTEAELRTAHDTIHRLIVDRVESCAEEWIGAAAEKWRTLTDDELLQRWSLMLGELNRRQPPRKGQHRRIEIVDRELTTEVNLAEVEASNLVEILDAIAAELRHRDDVFGRMFAELGDYSDRALSASLEGMTDDQLDSVTDQASALARVVEVATSIQIARKARRDDERG
jgi:hypothetical protein